MDSDLQAYGVGVDRPTEADIEAEYERLLNDEEDME